MTEFIPGPEPPEVIERLEGRGGELQLQRRNGHYEIIYNGVFLMATYNGASERAAVRRALEHLSPAGGIRVLLGGLGVGYSLQEALRSPRVAAVVVAEIEPAVIRWNSGPLAALNGNALNDPRVELKNEPFEELIFGAGSRPAIRPRYHLVMVDTDNGSTWLSRAENAVLYSPAGLAALRACLARGGIVSFWCARRESELEQKLPLVFSRFVYEAVLEQTGQEAGFYLAW